MTEKTPEERLAAREESRAKRHEALERARAEQRIADLDFLEILEAEHGETNVATVDIPYTPGLPTLAAVRLPTPMEHKRYRFRAKTKTQDEPLTAHIAEANEELADTVLVYPNAEVFAKMCAARPSLKAQLGGAAVRLTLGSQSEAGKL